MAHFSDKGAHCEAAYCNLLDFLPFTCEFCKQTFCLEHFRPEAHECPSPGLRALNRKALVCPVCEGTLRLTDADDADLIWQTHESSGECAIMAANKKVLQKCPVNGCREDLTLSNRLTCKRCHQTVCLRHRLQADHDCGKMPPKGSVKKSSIADYLKRKWSGKGLRFEVFSSVMQWRRGNRK